MQLTFFTNIHGLEENKVNEIVISIDKNIESQKEGFFSHSHLKQENCKRDTPQLHSLVVFFPISSISFHSTFSP